MGVGRHFLPGFVFDFFECNYRFVRTGHDHINTFFAHIIAFIGCIKVEIIRKHYFEVIGLCYFFQYRQKIQIAVGNVQRQNSVRLKALQISLHGFIY